MNVVCSPKERTPQVQAAAQCIVGSPSPNRSKSSLSHFLTTNADPYMNGAFQGPSAAEGLACTPKASHSGFTEGRDIQLRCATRSRSKERLASATHGREKVGLHRRKHGQPCRCDPHGR